MLKNNLVLSVILSEVEESLLFDVYKGEEILRQAQDDRYYQESCIKLFFKLYSNYLYY